jgi:hypothetical protein
VLFHRSILFWLGLFVLSFLVWAWADSRKNFTLWSYQPAPDRSLTIMHGGSSLNFSTVSILPTQQVVTLLSHPFGPSGYSRVTPRGKVRAAWLRAPTWEVRLDPGSSGEVHSLGMGTASMPLYVTPPARNTWLRIPHWLIIALYLPLWLGLSAWRAWKIARRMEDLTAPA